jgi:hypothetical protein
MSVAVLIQVRLKPERIADVLTTLKDRIEPGVLRSSGRRRERIFQRLNSDGDLLSMTQWESTEAFDIASTVLSAEFVTDAAIEPPRVHHLVRLLSFERPLRRSGSHSVWPDRADAR